jgi:hypothetical protein
LKDGRGGPPAAGEDAVSMFLRLSIPPQTEEEREAIASLHRAVIPEPTYGTQLQNYSVQGIPAEGRIDLIGYNEIELLGPQFGPCILKQVFRLRGKGFPYLRGSGTGDQLCRVTIEVPAKLTSKQKELLQEFDSLSNDHSTPITRGFFDKVKEVFGDKAKN